MGLAMVCWKLFPGLHCFPYAITVLPPSGGGSDYYQHHGFVATVDRSGDDSVHEGPLTS